MWMCGVTNCVLVDTGKLAAIHAHKSVLHLYMRSLARARGNGRLKERVWGRVCASMYVGLLLDSSVFVNLPCTMEM